MKCKSLIVMLVLTFAAWAQTATPNTPQSSPAPAKTKCACSAKMASTDAKDGQSCARKMGLTANGKETASCCDDNAKSCCGKDKAAKCMKNDKSASCCSDSSKDQLEASCCGTDSCSKDASTGAIDCGKGCCSGKNENATKSCCRKAMQS